VPCCHCPLGREEKKPSKEERNTNSFNIINIKTILLRKDKEMVKLPNQEDPEVEDERKDHTVHETSSRSPQKSLAITKGPQRAIP